MIPLLASGSIALDTTRTPFKTAERVLGGSASYFSISASIFSPVAVVAAVGEDFPQKYWKLLEDKKIDLCGVQKLKGKSFFFDSTFSYDMYSRKANVTELNVYKDFVPSIPDGLKKTDFLYLGTSEPEYQLKLLEEADYSFSVMDTIEFYIETKKDALLKTISEVDGVILNDIETRMLCKNPNILKCARQIQDMGPELVIIKKGENGSIMFYKDSVFPLSAFPLETVVDPTGAGDSFAGGFVGYLASCGKISESNIRKALAYGSVMGSFAIESFSVDRIASLTKNEVDERLALYKKLLDF